MTSCENQQCDDEDFRLRFRLRKDSVSDLIKILDKERSAPYTNAASANCFKILYYNNFSKSHWRFIWCFCICCMHHKVSRAIAKQKGQFLSFSENLAGYQEKVLWRCTLFNFLIFFFTFYDVVHFYRRCKLSSFLDWRFSRLKLSEVAFDAVRFVGVKFG